MNLDLRSVPHLRKGVYYTIKNFGCDLALAMPKTNKFFKDKPEFQPIDPNNINQLWMIQQISPNRYEIVHALSTLVIECMVNNGICKLEFGKQKSTQIFYIEDDFQMIKQNIDVIKTDGINYEPPEKAIERKPSSENTSQISKKKKEQRASKKVTEFKAGQKFVAKIRFKQKQKSTKYLFCEKVLKVASSSPFESSVGQKAFENKVNTLKFAEIDIGTERDHTLWEIAQVKVQENQILSQTCYISSLRSGYVLDVPEAAQKTGIQIIQYPCNFRFNQKWIFNKVDEAGGYAFYQIKNAKTGMFLDIKNESEKEGTPIIQWQNHQGKNQIWRLEPQGKRTYLIRSAMNKQLLLGIKDNSLKQCAGLVTCKIETDCFWQIFGCLPQ